MVRWEGDVQGLTDEHRPPQAPAPGRDLARQGVGDDDVGIGHGVRVVVLGEVAVVDEDFHRAPGQHRQGPGQQGGQTARQPGDADRADGLAAVLLQPGADPGEGRGDLVRAVGEQIAGRGEPQPAPVRLDERHPDVSLGGAQLLGERGGGSVRRRGDRGEAAPLPQVAEELEVTHIHEGSLRF